MGLARTHSVALVGVEGHVVDVEADLAAGVPGISLVGLPDTALSEAKARIRAAIGNSGESWPLRRMTIALLPAPLPKHGSHFDLALALSVLGAAGVVQVEALSDCAVLGELGLDGRVRPVRGVLPAAHAAARAGLRRALVPLANAAEASLVPDLTVWGVSSLAAAIAWLRGAPDAVAAGSPPDEPPGHPAPDLSDVVGQALGRRAVEVAAAGGHHLFLVGPPGSGKTMLAERLPGLLPRLDDRSALEVTAVHSVAGVLPPDAPLIRRPPFQDPHHTASMAALVGGGAGLARPGALSLAHRGVLFLDEAPEFHPAVLNALRQPLERGEILLARAGGLTTYPARCQLVLAANPCPCASPSGDQDCQCSASARRGYMTRISGPLLDRIDLHVQLFPVTGAGLLVDSSPEPSAAVSARVAQARAAATERLAGTGWLTNAEIPGPELRGRFKMPRPVTALAERALERGQLSARGYDRILRVGWTLADLGGRSLPDKDDLAEALGLRMRQAMAA